MKFINYRAAITAVASIFFAAGASASVYVETGDAGQTLGIAQVVPGGTSTIFGNLNSDADLYMFNWGGGSFYANTVGGTIVDSQLFLFGSDGVGILGNDDGVAYAGPAYISTTSLAQGRYYIGVSSYDYDPYSISGLIFQSSPYDKVYGPSNSDPLVEWSGYSLYTGSYEINFRQITVDGTPVEDPTPTTNVPEPASLTLVGLGLSGLAAARRRKN